nr:MAG TPA: hypothetical protein [Bacteriophage sp.]
MFYFTQTLYMTSFLFSIDVIHKFLVIFLYVTPIGGIP